MKPSRSRKMFRTAGGMVSLLGPMAWGLLVSGAWAATPVAVRFEELPKLVQERNQNVSGSEKLVHAAERRSGHLARSYLPSLTAVVGGESFQTGPYRSMTQPYGSAEVSVNLFRGGRDLLESKLRDAEVRSTEAGAKRTQRFELEAVRKTYWSIVFTQEMVGILAQALRRNEQNLAMANRRIQRGLGAEIDRLEFQIHRSQIEEEIESLKHGLILIQIEFAAQLGFGPGTTFETADLIEHDHDEKLLAVVADPAQQPDVVLAKANHEGLSYRANQANRWWMPSLDLYGGYYLHTLREREYLSQGQRDEAAVGARLTFELFDGLQSRAAANAFALQSEGYALQSEQARKTAQARVEVVKEDLKHDHELIHWAEERIAQGDKYLNGTLDEYSRGVKNSIDVLGAAQRRLAYEREYAERRRDYQLTKSELMALLGL